MGPKHLKETLKRLLPTRVPLFIWGPPGVGKSQCALQVAEEMKDWRYMDVRCVLHAPEDVKMPYFDTWAGQARLAQYQAQCLGAVLTFTARQQNGSSETLSLPAAPDINGHAAILRWVQSILPTDPNWKGIVCLEEIDKCGNMMQGAWLQPTLERMLGEYRVPEGVHFVLIGNRLGDQAGSHQIISPLRARCIHLDMDTSPDDWNDWALDNGIDHRVRTYVTRVAPGMLHKFNANDRASPNPRAWSMVSHIRKAYQEAVGIKSASEETPLYEPISGTVGPGAAAGFIAYCRVADHTPDVYKDVLDRPEKAKVYDEPDVQWAVCSAITEVVRHHDKYIPNAITYMLRLSDEFAVMLFRDMQRVNPKTTDPKGPGYGLAMKAAEKYANIILVN